jgi:hypothetical protein
MSYAADESALPNPQSATRTPKNNGLLTAFALASIFAGWNAPAISVADFYPKDTLQVAAQESDVHRENTWRGPGEVYDSFLGVEAYSNSQNGKFQCTELAHRFLRKTYGIPTAIGKGMGNANEVLANIFSRFGAGTFSYQGRGLRMRFWKNGAAGEPPAAGSAINFASGTLGHVAIVRYAAREADSRIRVYLFEQHGFPHWAVGEKMPVRFLDLTRNEQGKWEGKTKAHIGTPVSWLNFQVVNP